MASHLIRPLLGKGKLEICYNIKKEFLRISKLII